MNRLWFRFVTFLSLVALLAGFSAQTVSAQPEIRNECVGLDFAEIMNKEYPPKDGVYKYFYTVHAEGVGVSPCQLAVVTVNVWTRETEHDPDHQINFIYLIWIRPDKTIYTKISGKYGVGEVQTIGQVANNKAMFYTASILPETKFLVWEMSEDGELAQQKTLLESGLPSQVAVAFRLHDNCGFPSKLTMFEQFAEQQFAGASFDKLDISAVSEPGIWQHLGNCEAAYTTVWISSPSKSSDIYSMTFFAYKDDGKLVMSEPFGDVYFQREYHRPLSFEIKSHHLYVNTFFDKGQVNLILVSPDGSLNASHDVVWQKLFYWAMAADQVDPQRPVSYVLVALSVTSLPPMVGAFTPEWNKDQENTSFEVSKWICIDEPCTVQMMSFYKSSIDGALPSVRYDAFARLVNNEWVFVGLVSDDNITKPYAYSVEGKRGAKLVTVCFQSPPDKYSEEVTVNRYTLSPEGKPLYLQSFEKCPIK